MALLRIFAVTASVLLPSITFSLSVCNELDVNFVLDSVSILNSLSDIKVIMSHILDEGTSDFSDYKVLIYGTDIPPQYQYVAIPVSNVELLDEIHLDFILSSRTNPVDIKASEVIRQHHDTFVAEPKPHHKQQRFNTSISSETEYIVFAEKFRVFADVSSLGCGANIGVNVILNDINARTHFARTQDDCGVNVFSQTDLMGNNAKALSFLKSTTCKPKVYDDDEHEILLNYKAHFVDPETYIDCHFVYKSASLSTSNQLDEKESYIRVQDGVSLYTKYKKGYYMIVTRDDVHVLPDSCLDGGFVYQITDILPTEDDNVVELKIRMPQTMHEYIHKSNFTKQEKLKVIIDDDYKAEMARRLWWIFINDTSHIYDNQWDVGSSYSLANIEVSYGVLFGIDINSYFNFDWNYFSENEKLEFRIFGTYNMGFYIKLEISSEATIPLDIFEFVGNVIVMWVGIIPVWIKPYFKTTAELTILLPLELNTGVNCTHESWFNQGYKYDKVNDYQPSFGLLSEDHTLNVINESLGFISKAQCKQDAYYYVFQPQGNVSSMSCYFAGYNQETGECVCYYLYYWNATKVIAKDGWDLHLVGEDCDPSEVYCAYPITGCGLTMYEVDVSDAYCDYLELSYNYTCVDCTWFGSHNGSKIVFNDEYISESGVTKNECHRYYNLNWNDDDGFCATLMNDDSIGADITIEIVIGVLLYEIINIYSRIPILNEFRVQPIEMDPAKCIYSNFDANQNMCALDSVYFSTDLNISFSVFLGAVIEVPDAFSTAMNTLVDHTNSSYIQAVSGVVTDPSLESSIIENMHITYINLGCIAFNDISTYLNRMLSTMCCNNTVVVETTQNVVETTQIAAETTQIAAETTEVAGDDDDDEDSQEGNPATRIHASFTFILFASVQYMLFSQ